MLHCSRFQLSRKTMKDENEIGRPEPLSRIVSAMGNGSVKIITGIRRCGKSYLLNNLFRDYLRKFGVKDDHIIAVALDMDEFEELQNPRNLSSYVKSRIVDDGNPYYVFIDEIQESYKVQCNGQDARCPSAPPRWRLSIRPRCPLRPHSKNRFSFLHS